MKMVIWCVIGKKAYFTTICFLLLPLVGDPSKYISFYGLRTHSEIHGTPVSKINTVEPPLTDTSRRRTPLISGHFVMYPATYKHYIFNLP